jgi:polar amino acid transport system substrate-binding protein
MKRFCSLLSALMATVLILMSSVLTGCIGTTGTKDITLTPTIDTPAIVQSGVLKVGVDTTRAPFAGQSKNTIIGIDADIAAAIADQLGLRLELVDIAGENADTLLANGTVDVIMDIEPGGVQSATAHQVGPYLADGPALFMVELSGKVPDIDLATLAGASVAAQQNSLSAWQIGQLVGDSNIIPVASLEEAFTQLSEGRVTYAASDAVVGSFLAAKDAAYDNISCVKLLGDPLGVYMGVAAQNTALADALTTALRDIRDNGVLSVLITKWLGPLSAQVVTSDQAIVAIGAGNGNANANDPNNANANTPNTDTDPSSNTGSQGGGVDTGTDLPDPSNA